MGEEQEEGPGEMIARQELRQHHRPCVYDTTSHQLSPLIINWQSSTTEQDQPFRRELNQLHLEGRYHSYDIPVHTIDPMPTRQQANLLWPYRITMHLMHFQISLARYPPLYLTSDYTTLTKLHLLLLLLLRISQKVTSGPRYHPLTCILRLKVRIVIWLNYTSNRPGNLSNGISKRIMSMSNIMLISLQSSVPSLSSASSYQ